MEDINNTIATGDAKELPLISMLEALLFYFAEPLSLKKLSTLTKWDIPAIEVALLELDNRLSERDSGVVVIIHNGEVSLGTTPRASALIEALAKEELNKDLSKAALETLSIVCYKGPLTRADIDYVRGVNSTFILRNLQMRGIVEKQDNPADSRASLYAPTMQALQYMGVSRREDLPRYAEVMEQLKSFLSSREGDDIIQPLESEGVRLVSGEESSEDVPIVCDTNNDGIMTKEECAPESSLREQRLAHEADLSEESLMGDEFIDGEIVAHEIKGGLADV